jgi:hypothetical protein
MKPNTNISHDSTEKTREQTITFHPRFIARRSVV